MAKVQLLYKGLKIDILCNENDKLEKIIDKFCHKASKNKDELYFLYAGNIVDKNLTFMGLANSIDQKRKIMSLIVIDNDTKNESVFLKEIKELKEKLNEANKIINEQKEKILELQYKITMTKSEDINQINSLMNIIEKKDEEIKLLKTRNFNNKRNNQINLSDIKSISFVSDDQRISNYSIPCRGNPIFAKIEEELYKEFPEYRETNNYFLYQGKRIKRFKTINENNIRSGALLILGYFEKSSENINSKNKGNSYINDSSLKSINFVSSDQRIRNYSIPCIGNPIFAEIEEELYKEYPEYRETDNYFFCNGKIILRFKTINENYIQNGALLILNKYD
jgi:hypothetical protein